MIGHINGVKFYRIIQVGIFNMWWLAVLTGFSYQKMYGCFARTKNIGCNNEVAVLTR